MATKNCPACSHQVPVACKKCSCGHVFFTARRSATSTSRENVGDSPVDSQELIDPGELSQNPGCSQLNQGGSNQPTRRSGRVTRERPNFYDALEYENQTKRQRQLQRQSKAKPEEPESDEGSPKAVTPVCSQDPIGKEKVGQPLAASSSRRPLPKKTKRRGRPPGITGRKQGQAFKISNSLVNKPCSNGDSNIGEIPGQNLEYEDIMAGISAEKAVQFNIVLHDINRKILRASWNKAL